MGKYLGVLLLKVIQFLKVGETCSVMETHHQNDDIKYHLYNNEAIESKYDALIV